MSREPKLYTFDDFRTGISLQSSKFAEERNPASPYLWMRACAAAVNVITTEDRIEKFKGYTEYLGNAISGTPIITGLYEYKKTGAGAATFYIVCAGTKIYTASGGILTEIYSGTTAGAFFQFATFNNVCILLNGVDAPLYFNGSICAPIVFDDPTTIIGTAKPSFAEVFRNRIFYGGDAAYPHRVWTPAPGTYDNFDNTNSTVDSFDVSVGDGQKLTGIKAFTKDLLVLYKEGSVHRLSGSAPFGGSGDTFRIEEVSREFGCVAPRTIKQVGKDHLFFSSGGLKRLSDVDTYGNLGVTDPTYEIQSELSNLNWSQIDKAFAVYLETEDRRHYYLQLPTGALTENTQTYVLDVISGAIQPREGITAACGAVVNRVFYTGDYDGQVHQQLSGDNYNGDAIESVWESKWFTFGSLIHKKRFRHLYIYFETAGTASVIIQWTIMKSNGETFTRTRSSEGGSGDAFDFGVFDSAVFDVGADQVFKKNNLGRGHAIKLRVMNNSADERWSIRKIELGVQDLGRMG